MIETKDSILFARPDGALVLFLRAVRPVISRPTIKWDEDPSAMDATIGRRPCYVAATNGERVLCRACWLMVRVIAESRVPFRFVCLDCEEKELAEAVR